MVVERVEDVLADLENRAKAESLAALVLASQEVNELASSLAVNLRRLLARSRSLHALGVLGVLELALVTVRVLRALVLPLAVGALGAAVLAVVTVRALAVLVLVPVLRRVLCRVLLSRGRGRSLSGRVRLLGGCRGDLTREAAGAVEPLVLVLAEVRRGAVLKLVLVRVVAETVVLVLVLVLVVAETTVLVLMLVVAEAAVFVLLLVAMEVLVGMAAETLVLMLVTTESFMLVLVLLRKVASDDVLDVTEVAALLVLGVDQVANTLKTMTEEAEKAEGLATLLVRRDVLHRSRSASDEVVKFTALVGRVSHDHGSGSRSKGNSDSSRSTHDDREKLEGWGE